MEHTLHLVRMILRVFDELFGIGHRDQIRVVIEDQTKIFWQLYQQKVAADRRDVYAKLAGQAALAHALPFGQHAMDASGFLVTQQILLFVVGERENHR
ncbi:hypothetical protein D9M68_590440 [compost metagenome]